jgi:hypothetical protein
MRDLDPDLIRLVASRYGQLQGLFTVLDAAWPTYWGVMMLAGRYFERADVSDWWAVPLSLPLLIFMVLQWRWLRPRAKAFYVSRFGRVKGTAASTSFPGATWTSQGCMFGALLADARTPWLTITVALLAFSARPAWIVRRDWPHRWHWLPLLAAGIATAWSMSLMPSYGAALRHIGPWALAVGGAEAFAGLGDHLLLVRTLHGRPAKDAASSEETS